MERECVPRWLRFHVLASGHIAHYHSLLAPLTPSPISQHFTHLRVLGLEELALAVGAEVGASAVPLARRQHDNSRLAQSRRQ